MHYDEKWEGLTPEEKWNRATIANNFIFYKVMRNNEDVCKHLIEILLDLEIDHIYMHGEESIDIDWQSKGIRLDVYAKNAKQSFDLEIQAADTKELPERARYYQSVIDVDTLKSGQKYSELKDSYVIFICLTDIFNKGLALYTFENICRENLEIKLNDRAKKYFFIASNCDRMDDDRIKAFLKLLTTNTSSDDFTGRIVRLAEDAKHNTQWRMQYMEWERQRTYDREAGREEGLKTGLEQGLELGREEVVRNLLANGMDPELVAKSSGIDMQKVLELKEALLAEPVN